MRPMEGCPRSVLVVTPSPERRRDWAAAVGGGRTAVETCPGPSERCPLVAGLGSCPLVARADLVIYDVESAPPGSFGLVMRAHPGVEIVLARDRVVGGRHRPTPVMRRASPARC